MFGEWEEKDLGSEKEQGLESKNQGLGSEMSRVWGVKSGFGEQKEQSLEGKNIRVWGIK